MIHAHRQLMQAHLVAHWNICTLLISSRVEGFYLDLEVLMFVDF